MNRKGFAGGICIGLAALANMLAPHPVIGAILFCFGLFAILANDFKNVNMVVNWSLAVSLFCKLTE